MKTEDGTRFTIPATVKEIDVYVTGGLIEVHSTDFTWKSNTTSTVMDLKRYAKAKLGFRQMTHNKWRWVRPQAVAQSKEGE